MRPSHNGRQPPLSTPSTTGTGPVLNTNHLSNSFNVNVNQNRNTPSTPNPFWPAPFSHNIPSNHGAQVPQARPPQMRPSHTQPQIPQSFNTNHLANSLVGVNHNTVSSHSNPISPNSNPLWPAPFSHSPSSGGGMQLAQTQTQSHPTQINHYYPGTYKPYFHRYG